MEMIKIGALSPPDENRGAWARKRLSQALEMNLEPIEVQIEKVTAFTSTLRGPLVRQLEALAKKHGRTIIELAAGLIAGLEAIPEDTHQENTPETSQSIAGMSRVRPILHPLLTAAVQGVSDGKIVFAEAATGTGKGRAIAALAANAAARGDTVVISAPLSVTWQLLADLEEIEEAKRTGVTLVLGRPNFVSPSLLREWAEDQKNKAVLEWIDEGGRPLGERSIRASKLIGHQLCWLMEDAQELAEDLPVTSVMLAADADNEECPGEQVYRVLRGSHDSAGIILCSHHMLAAHIRQVQMRGLLSDQPGKTPVTSIPLVIDTLIVDEAHLLEGAFAAINSHSVHLRSLLRTVDKTVKRYRKPLLDAINALSQHVSALERKDGTREVTGRLDELEGLAPKLADLNLALEGINFKKLDNAAKAQLHIAHRAVRDGLEGRATIRFEFSPVLKYPRMTVGRANLDKAIGVLWDSVVGAALVSATLYNTGEDAGLLRWKLAVPLDRALYLPAVHPKWITEAVSVQEKRVQCPPDDSQQWVQETSEVLATIAAEAQGGTLVLCTSYDNAEKIGAALQQLGPRLIVQTGQLTASSCATQYRTLHKEGIRPVWIGLGAAWTGINLSDSEVQPEDDTMLTDLVVTRLPIGAQNSLTHQRRVAIGGFRVILQEAIWQFRQGLGRLIRRQGVSGRKIWVLDSRLDREQNWVLGFRKILSRYNS